MVCVPVPSTRHSNSAGCRTFTFTCCGVGNSLGTTEGGAEESNSISLATHDNTIGLLSKYIFDLLLIQHTPTTKKGYYQDNLNNVAGVECHTWAIVYDYHK